MVSSYIMEFKLYVSDHKNFLEISFILFISIFCIILAKKILVQFIDYIQMITFEKSKKRVLKTIEDGDLSRLKFWETTYYIKRYLLKISNVVSGREGENLKKVYEYCGFVSDDINAIYSWSYRRKLRSLNNLLKMGIDISDHANKLIHEKSPILRWLAMEAIIDSKKNYALLPLLSFIENEKNYENRGIIFHLMCKYAEYRNEDIAFILSHSTNKQLNQTLLKVLEIYPHKSCENILLKSLKVNDQLESYISTIKILSNYPSLSFFRFIKYLKNHEEWVIRYFVAKNLKLFKTEESVEMLAEYITDSNHMVRKESINSLIEVNIDISNRILADIFKNPSHPAFQILKNNQTKKEFFKEAG